MFYFGAIAVFRVYDCSDKVRILVLPLSRDIYIFFHTATSGDNKQMPMPKKKETKWYHCAAEGCTSDDRKRAKYPYMQKVQFFPFPTKKKNPKLREKWLQLLRRDEKFFEPNFKQRVCSLHFIDGEPTKEHPYPELFAYNNFRNITTQYGTELPPGERSFGTLQKLDTARHTSCTVTPDEDLPQQDTRSIIIGLYYKL